MHVCTQNQFGGSMYAVCFSVSVLTVTAMLFAMQFSSLFSQWTCQVLARCIRSGSKPVFNNHQAWFWQNMSDPLPGFPLYDSCVLLHMAQIILCKTSPDLIWFWLTVGLWPNESCPEASRWARIIGSASKLIQIGCEFDLACLLERYHSLPTVPDGSFGSVIAVTSGTRRK